MPKARHKTLTDTNLTIGSLTIELDENGVGEFTDEYYKHVVSGELKDFEPLAKAGRTPAKYEDDGKGKIPDVLSKSESASTAIVTIDGLESAEAVEAYIVGEARVSVLKAAEVKLEELKKAPEEE